jgi:hypothetical protein
MLRFPLTAPFATFLFEVELQPSRHLTGVLESRRVLVTDWRGLAELLAADGDDIRH